MGGADQLFAFGRLLYLLAQAAELAVLLQIVAIAAGAGQRRVADVQQHLECLLLIEAVELMPGAHLQLFLRRGEGDPVAERRQHQPAVDLALVLLAPQRQLQIPVGIQRRHFRRQVMAPDGVVERNAAAFADRQQQRFC